MFRYALLLLALSCCSFRLAPDSVTDSLVMKAAENQLEVTLGKIHQGNEAAYGFTEKDDLDNCGIAKPYRIVLFNEDFYSGPLEENTIYVEIKNEWRVPVTLKGEHRALMTLDGNPGNFVASGLGAADLAKELEYKSAKFDENDSYYLLRIPLLSAYFFVSEPNNSFADAVFIPLASAIKAIPALDNSKKSSYSLDEVQQMVKNALTNKPVNEPVKKKSNKKKTKK